MASPPSVFRARCSRLLAAATGVVLVMAVFGFGHGRALVDRMDRALADHLIRYTGGPPERDEFVLLGIDDASLSIGAQHQPGADGTLGRMAARFPWDRRVWADVIDRLAAAGARLIVLDLLLSEPADPEADAALAAAIARHRDKVVLASAFSPNDGPQDAGRQFLLLEPAEEFLGENWDTRHGYVNFYPDTSDGLVRSARYTTTLGIENEGRAREGEPVFRSLAAEIIHALGAEVPEGEHELRFASKTGSLGSRIYAPRSLYGIFVDEIWEKNYDEGEFFRDKVVMVGPVSPRFHDIHTTPVGPLTGPQLHLQAVASGLERAFVRRLTDPWPGMLVLGLVGLVWTQTIRRPLVSVFGMLGIVAMTGVIVAWAAASRSLLLPVSGGLLALGGGWMVALSYDLVTERLEKQRVRREFRRFVSRDVADALVEHPEEWTRSAVGVKRPVVVLFSDVRGFTSRSEQSDPAALVAQLNEYLTAMVRIVFQNGGTLDKFIGDAVMAHWGALGGGSDAEYAGKALATARGMISELERLNVDWISRGLEPFRIGIGIHLGEVLAGEIGSPDRTEFAVIGDAVNLASRLEGLTKTFGCEVIFSEDVRRAADDVSGIDLGPVRVKGRAAPVVLYGLGETDVVRGRLADLERDPQGVVVMETK